VMKLFRLLLLLVCCVRFMIASDQEKLHLIKTLSSKPEVVDLIVINDLWDEGFTIYGGLQDLLPWLPSDDAVHLLTITNNFVHALSGKHAVLCTKTLWFNIRFLGNMWHDFVYLSEDDLLVKYGKYDATGENLTEKIQKSKQLIQQLHQYLPKIQKSKDPLMLVNLIDGIIKHVGYNRAWLCQLYLYHQLYVQLCSEGSYGCKEINDLYLVFIPKDKLLADDASNANIDLGLGVKAFTKQDLYLGMHWSKLPSYEYYNDAEIEKNEELLWNLVASWKNKNGAEKTGELLLDALQKLFMIKKDIDPSFHDFLSVILPRYNLFISGHGAPQLITAGITDLSFKNMIKFCDTQIFTKSMTVSSCYVGGQRFKTLMSSGEHQEFPFSVADVSYPILFVGSFLAITFSKGLNTSIKNLHESLAEKRYESFFNALHAAPPEYFKALEILGGIYDSGDLNLQLISNYGSIKFPHVAWVTASNYRKKVKSVSAVSVATAKNNRISINKGKTIILMNTNQIPVTLNLKHQVNILNIKTFPVFLPTHYQNQSYVISSLNLKPVKNLHKNIKRNIAQILYQFFCVVDYYSRNSMQEPVSVIINTANIGKYKVRNVFIEIDQSKIYFELQVHEKWEPVVYLLDRSTFNLKFPLQDSRMVAQIKKDMQKARRAAAVKDVDASAFTRKEFIKLLQKNLVAQQSMLPKRVQDSKNEFEQKKAKGLNPNARPFVPKSGKVDNNVLPA